MEIIKRLQELREEIADLERGRGEVMVEVIKLEGELEKTQKAKRDKILDRFKGGQPVKASSLESKIEDLSTELHERKSIIEAIDFKLAEIRPQLGELEEAQKEAEGWAEYALCYVCARILSSQVTDRIRRAFADAPARRIKMSDGGFQVEKSVPACLGAASMWKVGQLDFEAVKALHTLDPARFPRPERVDLDVTAMPTSSTPRPGVHDRASFDRVWEEFLAVRDQFLREHGVDLGPSDSEIETKLASPR